MLAHLTNPASPILTPALEIPGELIGFVAVSGGFVVAIVAILGGMITAAAKNKQRERTRREIAAYVAEGSISPDEGERLMEAGAIND